AAVSLIGAGPGQLRKIRTLDGKEIIERLEEVDNTKRFYRYTEIAGIGASHYAGVVEVKPNGSAGCTAVWRVQFLASGQPDIVVRTMVSTLLETGLGSLQRHFAVTDTLHAGVHK